MLVSYIALAGQLWLWVVGLHMCVGVFGCVDICMCVGVFRNVVHVWGCVCVW